MVECYIEQALTPAREALLLSALEVYNPGMHKECWNPVRDSGHAFDLSAHLCIGIDHTDIPGEACVIATIYQKGATRPVSVTVNFDEEASRKAATRLAVCLLAAKIRLK
jgi:hypothetical protein